MVDMTDKNGTKQFLVRLQKGLHQELAAEAKARGLSTNALVSVILLDALRKKYTERAKR